jgi:ABC-type uncharacterized transport system permease subunit
MFQILESTESKIAVPIGILMVVAQFLVVQLLGNSSIANILVPGFALILGVAVGWVLGEAFIYSTGISQIIWGALSALFGASVTFDTFRQQVSTTREKVFYLLSLIPVTDPKIINAILWFSLAFIVSFVLSVGLNHTRRMEKAQKNAQP